MKKYLSWLQQAQSDLSWGKDSHKAKHYAQTCFIAQQVAEKALKALAYYRGFDMIKSHSVTKIAQELNINSDILKAGRRLDQYYISSRYPDALPDIGVPSDFFDADQSQEALCFAEMILKKVQENIE